MYSIMSALYKKEHGTKVIRIRKGGGDVVAA